MAAGSDFVRVPICPFDLNGLKLELRGKAVISLIEAIIAAIKIDSEASGIDSELRSIEPGKLADLIIVDSNSLEDIRISQDDQKPKLVMKGGEILELILS